MITQIVNVPTRHISVYTLESPKVRSPFCDIKHNIGILPFVAPGEAQYPITALPPERVR